MASIDVTPRTADSEGGERVHRPLLLLTAALVLGTLVGRWVSSSPSLGARAAIGATGAIGAALLALLFQGWRARRARRRSEGPFDGNERSASGSGAAQRTGRGRAWIACALALACARAALVQPTESAGPREVARGAWDPEGGARGRLGAATGAPLVELDGTRLAPGERAALLAGEAPLPWPRGPVPGPRARSGVPGLVPALPDQVVRAAPPPGSDSVLARVAQSLARARDAIGARLDRVPASPEARGLARALLIGDRSGVAPEVAAAFVHTGTRHLLAVSGLHVAWAGLLGIWPLGALLVRASRAWFGRAPPVGLVRALLLALYAPLAGGAAPVVRASLAGALVALAPHLGRGRAGRMPDGLSLWSLALALELISEPRSLGELPVLLSYAATLGLILGARAFAPRGARAFAPRGARAFAPRGARAFTPGRPARARDGELAARVARAGLGLVGASLAATLATLPIVWSAFGEVSAWSVVLTPLALPLVAALLAAGWLAALAPDLVPAFALDLPTRALLALLGHADALPGTPTPLPERPPALVALAVVLAFAAARGTSRARFATARARLERCAALVGALVLVPWSAAPRGLEVHALDVGHGSAFVLRAPGEPCLVFDAGTRDRPFLAREALAPLLARWEVARPRVALSHGHRDHHSGLAWLVERYPPRLFAGHLPAEIAERLPADCERIDLARGAVELPRPSRARTPTLVLVRGRPGPDNEGSRSLRIEDRGAVLVVTGDAEAEGLAAQLAYGGLDGPLDLLVLPHHGSDTPWLGPLLEAAAPAEVWCSSPGEPAVAAELRRRGIEPRWTGRDGPLTWPRPRNRGGEPD